MATFSFFPAVFESVVVVDEVDELVLSVLDAPPVQPVRSTASEAATIPSVNAFI
jgi:hypothetical protein